MNPEDIMHYRFLFICGLSGIANGTFVGFLWDIKPRWMCATVFCVGTLVSTVVTRLLGYP